MVYYKAVESKSGRVIEISRREYVSLRRAGKIGNVIEAYEKIENAMKPVQVKPNSGARSMKQSNKTKR